MDRPTRTDRFFARFINGIYGNFKKEEQCECSSNKHLYAKTISLAEFRLQPIKYQIVVIILVLICVSFAVGAVTCGISHPSLLTLLITIPVGIISILFGLMFTAMWIGGRRSYHRYVQFEFNCNECNHTHNVTYDCLTMQKRNRCGQYTSKTCREVKTPRNIDMQYEFVKQRYDEMLDGLDRNPLGYNCIDWANEFYAKFF